MLRERGLFFTVVSILVLSLALVGCTRGPAQEKGSGPSDNAKDVDDSLDRVLDSGITGSDQMKGKEIGVVTGETFAEDAQGLGADVVPYEGVNQILMELLNGRVDGMITDRLVALNGMNQIKGGDELTLTGDLLRLEEMALAVRQEDIELGEKLNEILQEMHDDSTLKRISEKWHDGRDITVK